MREIIYQTSRRKRQHITFDERSPICSVKHKNKSSLIPPGSDKNLNCKNCKRVWTALKNRRRKEFIKSIRS